MARSSLVAEEVVLMTVTRHNAETPTTETQDAGPRDAETPTTETRTTGTPTTGTARALRALEDDRASVRLKAALAVGTAPDPDFVPRLIERCAVEPEFFVRDMLTWALTRHPVSLTLPALLRELGAGRTQARSQALHTLSKVGDRRAWPAITHALLTDPEDEVARSAWRAAVVLAPEDDRPALAAVLATQLGRGGRETQLSLSRALVALAGAAEPALLAAVRADDPGRRAHALATRILTRDPDAGFAFAVEEAKRVVALDGAPGGGA
ncbi:HEAT repeat domain-containing protein [Streptomyces sp. NPDC047130]|uniref:HEAT repeat domain-containing protein n=1 Tax=Streptomyces sp. NPDC047130 TaxID=3155261 RepID=UPI003402FB08